MAAGKTRSATSIRGVRDRFVRLGGGGLQGGAFAPHGGARRGLPRRESAVNRGGDNDGHGGSGEKKTEGKIEGGAGGACGLLAPRAGRGRGARSGMGEQLDGDMVRPEQ